MAGNDGPRLAIIWKVFALAVLIALSSVAAVMARNAVEDNKALVQGLGAQYEMGVEAGKMARNAKYAEAMADIVGGISQD